MRPVTLLVAGQRCRLLEPIASAGVLLGLPRTTSYRCAARDRWPLVDTSSGRGKVAMIPFLEQHGIPYYVEGTEAMSDEQPTPADQAFSDSLRDVVRNRTASKNKPMQPVEPDDDSNHEERDAGDDAE